MTWTDVSTAFIILNMTYNIFHERVVRKIKQVRLEKGLTQENMEEGVYALNVRTYQRIENSETDITLKNLYLISKQLDVDIKEFFNFE